MQTGNAMTPKNVLTDFEDGLNQSPVFENVNLFETDRPLREALAREGAAWAHQEAAGFGKLAGSAHVLDLGRLANENPPQARLIDQKGRRIDTVEFHPAYHELMALSFRQGLHCGVWPEIAAGTQPREGGQVARAAKFYMLAQAEGGHLCPITMTHAAFASLRVEKDLFAALLPKLTSRDYDPSFAPLSKRPQSPSAWG